jgi:hypothetical protein
VTNQDSEAPQAHNHMTPHAALRVLDIRLSIEGMDDEVRAALDRLWSLMLQGD